jgi:hypothetical protein
VRGTEKSGVRVTICAYSRSRSLQFVCASTSLSSATFCMHLCKRLARSEDQEKGYLKSAIRLSTSAPSVYVAVHRHIRHMYAFDNFGLSLISRNAHASCFLYLRMKRDIWRLPERKGRNLRLPYFVIFVACFGTPLFCTATRGVTVFLKCAFEWWRDIGRIT